MRLRLFRNIGIFILILIWIFSGWPRIWQNPPIPPEIQEAQAAAPTWQASSAIAASTGADVTVTLPAHLANDILLLQVVVRDVDDTITWPSGWTQIATVDRGTTARYWWAWKRAASSAETNPLVDKSTATGDTYAAVTTSRGATTVGDPWEVKGTPNTATTAAHVLNGITTLSANSLIVASLCGEDNTAATGTTFTATDPATLTQVLYVESATGADGACTAGAAAKAAVGATGSVTATWTATVVGSGGIVLALKELKITTIADGTNPGNTTIAPSAAITDLDAFTLATDIGTDSVTALTVTLTGANSFESLSEVRITSNDGATLYFAAVAPTSNTVSFSGGAAIPVSTAAITFKVRITPKTHANMPVPPGLSYAVGGTVTALTSTNPQSGTDGASATITVDNLSPDGATSTSGSAGNTQVTLNWTTSASSDFSRSVVLRWAASTPGSEVPAEGTDYSVDQTITTATVACVRTTDAASTAVSGVDGAGTGGCRAVALTNGQAYSYKVFQKDSRGNYDVGVTFTGSPFTPAAAPTLTFSISDNTIGFGTLSASAARFATGTEPYGSATEVEAHTLSASTNASGGYIITVDGNTLTSGSFTITAIGGTAQASNPGTEQFGMRLIVNSGTGSASAPYNGANWALDTAAFPDQVASGSGDGATTVFGVRYIANISSTTEAGNYSATLTCVATATF